MKGYFVRVWRKSSTEEVSSGSVDASTAQEAAELWGGETVRLFYSGDEYTEFVSQSNLYEVREF